ncbi:MAG TPA: hypothetical protein VKY92_05695 [Verrucomicrobiae bacterium]|nr:hypothetical protein [Verrucomicrobiae bacterium]
MDQPEKPNTLPLAYAAQIAYELNSMRRECSEFAMRLLSKRPLDEANLEECARLDDALARAHGVLNSALDGIKSPPADK